MCICPHPSKASLGFFVVNQKDVLENQSVWESCGMNQKKLQEEQILISVKLVVAERERRTCASLTCPPSSTSNTGNGLTAQMALDKEPRIKGKALSLHANRSCGK